MCVTCITCITYITCLTCVNCIPCIIWFTENLKKKKYITDSLTFKNIYYWLTDSLTHLVITWNQEMLPHIKICYTWINSGASSPPLRLITWKHVLTSLILLVVICVPNTQIPDMKGKSAIHGSTRGASPPISGGPPPLPPLYVPFLFSLDPQSQSTHRGGSSGKQSLVGEIWKKICQQSYKIL